MYTDYRTDKILEVLVPVFDYFGTDPSGGRYWSYCGVLQKYSADMVSTHRFRIHQNYEDLTCDILQAISTELTKVFLAHEYFCTQGSDYVSDSGIPLGKTGHFSSGVFTRQILIDITFQDYGQEDYGQDWDQDFTDQGVGAPDIVSESKCDDVVDNMMLDPTNNPLPHLDKTKTEHQTQFDQTEFDTDNMINAFGGMVI